MEGNVCLWQRILASVLVYKQARVDISHLIFKERCPARKESLDVRSMV